MSKISEVLKAKVPNLSDEQIQNFEKSFLALDQEFTNADDTQLNDTNYRTSFAEKFDKLLVELGYGEFDPEPAEDWLYDLYQDDYKAVVGFIVVSYKEACDEDDLFKSISYAMYDEFERDFEDDE